MNGTGLPILLFQMTKLSFRYLLLTLFFSTLVHAQSSRDHPEVRVAWDYSSLRQIAEKGGYPRMIKLENDNLLAVYENYTGDVELKRSYDQGNSWSAPQKIFSQFSYTSLEGKTTLVKIANPEIIQLPNQDLVLAVNYRPVQDEIAPFSIVISRSSDQGYTWSDPQTVYNCAPRFRDGCWEPSFLWLPDNELQLYFANENPYQESDEQEISMIHSADFGKTWTTEAKRVSFRKNRRDGMPVGILKKEEIILAIEDNKIGEFKPYLVRTTVKNNWKKPVLGNSSKREYALRKPQEDSVYMGAPYLINLPGGGSLLSYQTTKGRSKDWEKSTMEVVVGDDNVRNFDFPTQPFPVSKKQEAKWNSLAILDNYLVAALSSTNFDSGEVAPWMIRGHVIPNTIKIADQEKAPVIFVGSDSDNNLRLQVRKSNDHLELVGEMSVESGEEESLSEVLIYLKHKNKKYKIDRDPTQKIRVFQEVDEEWEPYKDDFLHADIQAKKEKRRFAYELRKTHKSDSLKIGIGLIYKKNKKQVTEYLVHMNPKDEDTWIQFVP